MKLLEIIGLLLGATILLPSCVTEVESSPFHGNGTVLHRSEVTQIWHARCAGDLLGSVLQYHEATGKSHVVVQNPYGQDLGLVDSLGRAWRYQAHQEPAWVGSGTVKQGVAWILGCGPVDLVLTPAPPPLGPWERHPPRI